MRATSWNVSKELLVISVPLDAVKRVTHNLESIIVMIIHFLDLSPT